MDDVRFWYESVFLNDDLMPSKPSPMKRGDTLMEFVFDDLTFQIVFPTPFPSFIPLFFSAAYGFGGWGWPSVTPILPSHYLAQYHIDFNDKATDLAKGEGFDYWYQLIGSKNSADKIERPVLGPWYLETFASDAATFVRNPYYFKVDPQGNQLPYVDYVEVRTMADPETYKLSVIGGETDYALPYLTVADYPLLKENEERGGYTVDL